MHISICKVTQQNAQSIPAVPGDASDVFQVMQCMESYPLGSSPLVFPHRSEQLGR